MVTAVTPDVSRFDVRDIRTPLVSTHLVVLVNDRTGQERSLVVETLSTEFYDVWREVQFQKGCDRTLRGFTIFDVLPLDTALPF